MAKRVGSWRGGAQEKTTKRSCLSEKLSPGDAYSMARGVENCGHMYIFIRDFMVHLHC